ncbi:MAG: DUF3291 domain-containing protein [Paracoccaceae bacterium]
MTDRPSPDTSPTDAHPIPTTDSTASGAPVLVHLNVVRPVAGFDVSDPNPSYFFRQFPRVAAQARTYEGMRWHTHGARMPDGRYLTLPEFTALRTDSFEANPHIMTMAGWRDVAALHAFAYRTDLHRAGVKTLRDWVDRSEGPTLVMWWDKAGRRVGLEEAWDKLCRLRREGPSQGAFTLQQRFEPCI